MNQATRDTVDAFVTSVYDGIQTAQDTYKLNNRDDNRYENGRFFNEPSTHNVYPADGVLKNKNNAWTEKTLPTTMPCSLRTSVLEYRDQMGWLLIIDYLDDGIHYQKIIDTLDVLSQDWLEVPST
jgi:hypothetical protein